MPTAYLFPFLTVCMWQWINQKVTSLKALRTSHPSHKLNKAVNKNSSKQPSFQRQRLPGKVGAHTGGSGLPQRVVSSNPPLTQRTKTPLQLCTSQVVWACKKLTRGHQRLTEKENCVISILMFQFFRGKNKKCFAHTCAHAHTHTHRAMSGQGFILANMSD